MISDTGYDVSRLRRALDGEVMLPGDDGYDSARGMWNAMADRRPAVVARCTSNSDVAAAIAFARQNDLEIGVRCGGHSILGNSVPEGGLLIDLAGMRGVRVDSDARRAWVQGGALLGDLDRAAQEFGMATTAGNVSHTGVGGLTLGGGMGWLARRFGLACDNVASYEIVTADGATLRVSESQHEDLFWGLRGGGGNFGVVTEFEFRLHQIGTTAVLIDNTFDLTEAPSAMRRWRDLLDDRVPAQATPVASVGTIADSPDGRSQVRNRTVASLGFVWVGDPDEGRQLVPLVDGLGASLSKRVEEVSYLRLQSMTRCTAQARIGDISKATTFPNSPTMRSRRSCPKGNSILAPTDHSCQTVHFRAMAARSRRQRTTTRPSVTATRWSSSSPLPAGRIRQRMASGWPPPAASALYSSRTRAAFTSTCLPMKVSAASVGRTRQTSSRSSPLSSGATTRTTSSTSTRTSDRVRENHADGIRGRGRC